MDKINEMELRDELGKNITNDKKFLEILKILEKRHQYHQYPECPPSCYNIFIVLFLFSCLIIFILICY